MPNEINPNEVQQAIQKQEVVIHNRQGAIIEVREKPKSVSIAGEIHKVNALELARMIKNVTQQIGYHKRSDNAYSSYMLNSLRTMRNQMISDLEHYFRIGHVISESGKSVFYKLGRDDMDYFPRSERESLPRSSRKRLPRRDI